MLQIDVCDSPLGTVWIAATERGVRAVTVPGGTREQCIQAARWRGGLLENEYNGMVVNQAIQQLRAYFAGDLRHFTLPLDLNGTPFQRRVWTEVATIPYGERASYAEIARRIGAPNAYRAVGAANGANPVAIIIPCHRLVGRRGEVTGYAGGLEQKRWLQDFERRG